MPKGFDRPTLFEWDGASLILKGKGKTGCTVPPKIQSPVPSKIESLAIPVKPMSVSHTESVAVETVHETPTQIVDVTSNPVTGLSPESAGMTATPLFEPMVGNLNAVNAPIYPDGRPITSLNHLMIFIRSGVEIQRKYTPSNGWVSTMRRAGSHTNPVTDKLVETLITSGLLIEIREGVYRGRSA